MEQISIFSALIARNTEPETKEEAVERSLNNANEAWKKEALRMIREIAQKQPCLTSDDVLLALDSLDVATGDTRALGGIFTQAARMKYIRKSGNYQPSKRKVCHSRPICIWDSLIYGR